MNNSNSPPAGAPLDREKSSSQRSVLTGAKASQRAFRRFQKQKKMTLDISDPDYWTRALQFTPTIHRDVYPAIEPNSDRAQRSANGKVVIVTGAGSGFGKVCSPNQTMRVVLDGFGGSRLTLKSREHVFNGQDRGLGRLLLLDDEWINSRRRYRR